MGPRMIKSLSRKSGCRELGRNTGKVISIGLFPNKNTSNRYHIGRFGKSNTQKTKDKAELRVREKKKNENKGVECTQSQILALSYPIFKVVYADGNLSQEKHQLLTQILSNCLDEIYKGRLNKREQKKLAQLYIKDLLRVNTEKEKLEIILSNTLPSFSLDIKNSIIDLMIKMAENSGGIGEFGKKNNILQTYRM